MNERINKPVELFSVEDVARELRISSQRVRQLIAEEKISATRVGGNWVIEQSEIPKAKLLTTSSTIFPRQVQLPSQSMKSLSFFSGAMGLDLGLEKAGIRTCLTCESDKWARQTISTNRPDLPILGDIWKYNPEDIREIAQLEKEDQIDIIAGGPPCQAFSTAGSRRGFDDQRGNVFLHYLDLIKELRPRYAVIENVRGLLSMPVSPNQAKIFYDKTGIDFSVKHGAIKLVTKILRDAGYRVSFNLYNAANFGVPQNRERVIIIATLDEKPVPYLSPTNSNQEKDNLPPWRTVREALIDMVEDEQNFIPFPEKRLKYYRMLGPGQYWKDLPPEQQPEAMGKSFLLGGGKTGFYRRIAWDKPSPTLVTHPAMPATDLGHPVKDRPLSIEEYKRIQQFPAEWKITGNLTQQYKQVGNAVPLGLGEAIGRTIISHSQGKQLLVPDNFKFSRYKKTSDAEIDPPHNLKLSEKLF